jgi:PTS hybrid protein
VSASSGRVGLVIVSHSDLIARGIVELAAQMAPDVALVAAGGTKEGRIGTDFDRVMDGIRHADQGAGAVLVCDLGSAVLTAESAIEFVEPERAGRLRVADAPIVEGAVAAAVAAQTGDSLDAVLRAARSAAGHAVADGAADSAGADRYVREATLINDEGLHARPAAEFVRLASEFDAKVTVNGKDAKSLLGIMSLGLLKGARVEIASDRGGAAAVDALASLVESGFGEGGAS